MAKITFLSLFVINKVKLRRLIRGIPAERLSFSLKHSHGYVLTIENPKLNTQYPVSEWPNLAQELHFETHDLLPPDEMDQTSDGTKVEKKVLTLRNQEDMFLVVKGLIDYGFFDENKTIGDVAKHLFIEEKKIEREILKETLSAVVKDCLLLADGDFLVKNS